MNTVITTHQRESKKVTGTFVKNYFCQLKRWHHNYRSRRHLNELPPHLLDDLGLSPDQVAPEVSKPFWRN